MDPFIGMIVMFGGNFAPRGWALCSGQLLPISQNTALFSILGTTYGGDGRTTFALPDLRGRVPMHAGNGPGLTSRRLGQRAGSETHTLSASQMPSHTHVANASFNLGGTAVTTTLDNNFLAGTTAVPIGATTAGNQNLEGLSVQVGNTGNGEAFNIVQPFQVVNFIIALQGVFPSRS